MKADQRACVIGLPESFASDVASITLEAPSTALRGTFDIVFCAVDDEAGLARIARCRRTLRPAILAYGLVDTKVVSFSATHTAAKAVIPVAARAAAKAAIER